MTKDEQIQTIVDVLFENTTSEQLTIEKCYELAEKIVEKFRPQLRESEDERIRKKIIDIVKAAPFDEEKDVLLDYLEKQKDFADNEYWRGFGNGRDEVIDNPDAFNLQEKQKEQKPAERIEDSVKFEEGFKAGRESGLRDGQKYVLNNLDSYGLCKVSEWSEDYREEDIQTRFAFYTYKDDPSVLYLSNVFVEETSRNHGFGTRILKAAEKVAEAIGAIAICLKVKQDSPANAWYRKRGYGYVAFEDGYDWLEKNLEYLKPAKSAEWSKDDEKLLDFWLDVIDRNDWRMDEDFCKASREFINRLKSLRPQPKQEWSKEDENKIERLAFLISVAAEKEMISEEECIDLRKFVKSYHPQPQKEWSKEDELMRKRCIVDLGQLTGYEPQYKERFDEQIEWLESLRPWSHWKPSKEQMEALAYAIQVLNSNPHPRSAKAYQDLQTLFKNIKYGN